MTGTAYGIGVGPGDPELMTLKGQRLLRDCPVVAYPAPLEGDSLARRIAAPHLGEQTEIAIRMPIEAARFPAQAVYDDAATDIGAHLDAGRDVAVLCEGDPFFYGSFMYLFARLGERWPVEVVSGVSSLTAAAAVLAAPLASRNDVLTVLPAPLDDDTLRARLETTDAVAVIKLGRHFARIQTLLQDAGFQDCAYVEHATMANQRIVPLAEVDPATVPYFSMVLAHRRGRAWT